MSKKRKKNNAVKTYEESPNKKLKKQKVKSYTADRNKKAEKLMQYSLADKAKNAKQQEQKQQEQAKPAAVPVLDTEEALQRQQSGPTAPQRSRIGIEESIQRQLSSYEASGYEPTHTVCSILGYLIGVKESFFLENEHSYLQRSIYKNLDEKSNMRLIRLLCMLRMQVMRRYAEFDKSFRFNEPVLKLITDKAVDKIHQVDGSYDIAVNHISSAADYLWKINEKLKTAVDQAEGALQRMLPEGVDAERIKPLLLFPSTTRKETVYDLLKDEYWRYQNSYPWQTYINIRNIESGIFHGNPLAGDDELVKYAYQAANCEFHDVWRLRTPCPPVDTLQNLHDFLMPDGRYTYRFLIDGTTVAVDEVLAILRTLTEDELERLSQETADGKAPVHLFCCHDIFQNWRYYLGDYEKYIYPIEVASEANSGERMEDIGVNFYVDLFGMPASSAFVLVTRSAEVFEQCIRQPVALCVLTDRYADCRILDYVAKNRLKYGFIGDFAKQELPDRTDFVKKKLQKQFPVHLKQNLQKILEDCLLQIPVTYSDEEKQKLLQELIVQVRLDVDQDGSMRLRWQPESTKA